MKYITHRSASEAYKIMGNSIFCFGEYITVNRVTRSLLEIGNYFYIKRNVTFLNNEMNSKIKFMMTYVYLDANILSKHYIS